jgi:Sulfotransferase domain
MNWTWLLEDFRAASDFPICWLYREILEAFPNAKVVLTVRDPQSWASSVQALYKEAFLRLAKRPSMESGYGRSWVETVESLVWNRLGDLSDVGALCRVYEDHIKAVREHVLRPTGFWSSASRKAGLRCASSSKYLSSDFPHLNERAALNSVGARA